jgi:hypothetical protein
MPKQIKLDIFERERKRLRARHPVTEWQSPSMGVWFRVTPGNVELFYPDGRPFLSFVELGERQKQIEEALKSERQRAENERQRAENERQRAEKLSARLRELGIDPDSV